MAVARSNISSHVSETCRQLEILKSKIGDEVSYVNDDELKTAINSLEHEVNLLADQIRQSIKIDPIETELKKKLLKLVKEIPQSPAFSQAVGALSRRLLSCLKEIKNNMSKFDNKVTKADTDPLR